MTLHKQKIEENEYESYGVPLNDGTVCDLTGRFLHHSHSIFFPTFIYHYIIYPYSVHLILHLSSSPFHILTQSPYLHHPLSLLILSCLSFHLPQLYLPPTIPPPHYISPHYISPHSISPTLSPPHYISPHYISPHYIPPTISPLPHYISPPSISPTPSPPRRHRKVMVYYVCDEGRVPEIYSLKEVATCEYELVVITGVLCKHPRYKYVRTKRMG